jgi:FkbM family methyltransferase
MYSQNNEDDKIIEYFNNHHGGMIGTLLDLGANDGRTFSNSLRLIQKGWNAVLVEASKKAFDRCAKEHDGNDKVQCINIGVADRVGKLVFHESGEHIGQGDHALVSTFDSRELARWDESQSFTKTEINVVDYNTLMDMSKWIDFDFITMDIEGMETVVLPEMDLTNCKCICIEYNMNGDLLKYYTSIVSKFGLKEIFRNNENVIYGK